MRDPAAEAAGRTISGRPWCARARRGAGPGTVIEFGEGLLSRYRGEMLWTTGTA
ncbi:MAG: hypothetical protein ACLTBV_08455 [Enterocloster bolteae]